MLNFVFATAALAEIVVWESSEPLEVDIPPELFENTNIITYDQLNGALHGNDIGAMVDKHSYHAPANEACWSSNKPDYCPKHGYVKYEKVPFTKAKIGHAKVSVGANNQASLVIANVSMQIPPTKMTVQPKGIFTVPCDGTIKGLIHGAAAAVQGVVDTMADGVPILGEASAQPIDNAIVDLEHALDGVCSIIESILAALLDLCTTVLQQVVQTVIPNLVSGLLGDLVGDAGSKMAIKWEQ